MKYERALLPEDSGKQVGRIVDRFALLAVAGEMATDAGITGWRTGDAYNAAKTCLAAWLKDRGHAANQEEADALDKVRRFMTANQYTRFADWDDEKNRPANMVGYRRVVRGSNATEAVTTFYVLSSGWKEICGTSDMIKAAKLCRDEGWLDTDTGSPKNQKAIRLPEIGVKKVYVFNSTVIG
ncbi:hypothetical protein I2494_04565 [Budviciaceae bacterium BWR-B9]|uniref:Uncharacterized protein n=1 Tax=Limnobaculum allomyrinae TaxID=2791986 RepID=A0ABS1IML7_9GAMM|nr:MULTISPECIES: hypothetical protein [Limnobaculum]MBK5142995.1 hypothetical protein [Limnobaculum allomyrinae]MBV7693325.1 hypothetical protein [Limnobaculum sp. M2-1]